MSLEQIWLSSSEVMSQTRDITRFIPFLSTPPSPSWFNTRAHLFKVYNLDLFHCLSLWCGFEQLIAFVPPGVKQITVGLRDLKFYPTCSLFEQLRHLLKSGTMSSLYFLLTLLLSAGHGLAETCRSIPGDPDFPNESQWNALNASVHGRLANVVPSALDCFNRGGCTDEEWLSSTWRGDNLPGSMVLVRYSTVLPVNLLLNTALQPDAEQVNIPDATIIPSCRTKLFHRITMPRHRKSVSEIRPWELAHKG
jgi:hypothetical protein